MTTLARLAYDSKKKNTRREKFLEEMDRVIPWERLLKIAGHQYPQKGNGRQPMPVKQKCDNALDGLVTFAGLATDAPSPSKIASVNYFGTVDLLDGLLKNLQRGNKPAAVAISSMSAAAASPDDPLVVTLLDHDEAKARQLVDEQKHTGKAYVVSKAAVLVAVRRRAMDWGKAGVRLNADVGPSAE